MSGAGLTWPFVTKRIEERIADLHAQLEGAPIEAVPGLQGQIAGLRYVLTIDRRLPRSDVMIGDDAET